MAAGNHTLGTIRGSIEIDYDGAGIVRAIRDTDKMKSSGDKLSGASNKVLGAFGKFAGGAIKVSGALGTVSSAGTAVAGVLAAVGPLAAAGFAAAPAVILAYASTMAIAKIAVAGVGDAMAASAEGGKKFDDAMKKLSPEARKFVQAYKEVSPALDGVKKSIQDAFFKGAAGQVKGVGAAIQSLGPNAAGISGELGKIVQSTVKVATSGENVNRLKAVLAGVQAFLARIRNSIGPVVSGFLGLAAQAGKFGGVVGGKVANALAALAKWLSSIDLAALFAKAQPIIESISGLLTDVISIVSSLFSVFNVDGAGAVGLLGEMASQLADFLKSAEGQEALQALGTALQAVSQAGGEIFLALLQALAPAIIALAPGVTTLAGQISGVLVPAINTLNPVLTALAGFLSANMGWLGPLAGIIVAVAAGYRVYAAAAAAVATVQALMNSAVALSIASWIGNTAAIVANRIALVAGMVAMGVVRAATVAWTAVQWLLNAALTANPIGLVVLAIAALVAGIIYAYRNSETFRNIVQAVWAAIKVAIAAVVNWITGTVWPSLKEAWAQIASGAQTLWGWITAAWNGIKAVIQLQLTIIIAVVRAVWSAITGYIRVQINLARSIISAVINGIKVIWNAWLNGLKTVVRTAWAAIVAVVTSQINRVRSVIAKISAIVSVVRNAFTQANNAVKDKLNSVVSLARGLAGRVSSALGNIGGLLYSKGQALIRGFINGISSMLGAVKAKAQQVVSSVTRFLPGSPAKEGPLSGKGYVLLRARRFMDDFAQGLDDGAKKPRASMLGAVNPLGRATPSRSSSSSLGAVARVGFPTATGSGNRTYVIQLGEGVIANLVIDAITGNPVAVSKATNEGTRRSAWAGSGR